MIELGTETSPVRKDLSREDYLDLRKHSIMEFSDSAGNGYLIEEFLGRTYRFVRVAEDGDYEIGYETDNLYDALDGAISDWKALNLDSLGASWFDNLMDIRSLALDHRHDINWMEIYGFQLSLRFPPKIGTGDPKPADTDAHSELEEQISHEGKILDRLVGQDLTYFVQRNWQGFFRFVVLDLNQAPRYSESMSSELQGAYELILSDCELNYPSSRWSSISKDLRALLENSELDAESYLIAKKLSAQFPELNRNGRSSDELKVAAKGIAEIFGRRI